MEKEDKKKGTQKEIPTLRSMTHSKYYVTNLKGGATSQDIRFELMNEKILNESGESCFISDAMIILSPIGAKRFQKILNESIKKFEETNGEILPEPTRELFY